MINQIVKKISLELEKLTKYNISIDRALDLIEASTKNLNELIAINTMRESLCELDPKEKRMNVPFEAVIGQLQATQNDFIC